jgi:hypothetical protein
MSWADGIRKLKAKIVVAPFAVYCALLIELEIVIAV